MMARDCIVENVRSNLAAAWVCTLTHMGGEA